MGVHEQGGLAPAGAMKRSRIRQRNRARYGPLTVSLGAAVLCAVLFQGPGYNLYMLVPGTAALMAAGGLVLYGASRSGTIRLPWGPVPLLAAAYGLWLFLGPLWSTWPGISRLHFWILGAFPIGFLVAASLPNDDGVWRRLWPLLGLMAAGLGLWGMIEFAWRGQRTLGPTLDFNGYAALLNLFFFPAFAAALGAEARRDRYLGLALAALLGAAVWTTFSRAGIGLWLLLGSAMAILALRTFGRRASAPHSR